MSYEDLLLQNQRLAQIGTEQRAEISEQAELIDYLQLQNRIKDDEIKYKTITITRLQEQRQEAVNECNRIKPLLDKLTSKFSAA